MRGTTTLAVVCVGAALSLAVASCGGGNGTADGSQQKGLKSATEKTTTTDLSRGKSKSHPDSSAPPGAPTSTVPTTSITLSPPPTTTTTTTSSSGFRGIYEFAGNNSAADANNPDLAGVVLVSYWSQIEPAKGTFDWNVIETDMAPWVAAGKKVILRISTSGVASWDPPYSGSGTPQWVFGDGTRAISDNGGTIPVYWDQAYLSDYASFVQSFAQQFDGNPGVSFIEPGIGMGGETLAETNASAAGIASWEADGYSNAQWLTTVEHIASFFKTSFHQTPIFPLVDMTFFDGNVPDYDTLVSWFKAIPGWGLQYDGLSATSTLNAEWSGRPIALEQRDATRTSGDCLCSDISQGLTALHGNYLLIYQSDIDEPANAAYLRQAAGKATPAP
jgi:hypothetical protein